MIFIDCACLALLSLSVHVNKENIELISIDILTYLVNLISSKRTDKYFVTICEGPSNNYFYLFLYSYLVQNGLLIPL